MIFADESVVEQQSQSVMGEIAVSAGDPLGVFDLQVEVFGRPVAHGGVIEVGAQLRAPGVQGAPESGEFGDRAATQVGNQGLGAAATTTSATGGRTKPSGRGAPS